MMLSSMVSSDYCSTKPSDNRLDRIRRYRFHRNLIDALQLQLWIRLDVDLDVYHVTLSLDKIGKCNPIVTLQKGLYKMEKTAIG